jgi:hypothetical protein
MRTRATQIKSRERHTVVGVSEHWARGKDLIERHGTVKDVAVGQAEDALQIEWRVRTVRVKGASLKATDRPIDAGGLPKA